MEISRSQLLAVIFLSTVLLVILASTGSVVDRVLSKKYYYSNEVSTSAQYRVIKDLELNDQLVARSAGLRKVSLFYKSDLPVQGTIRMAIAKANGDQIFSTMLQLNNAANAKSVTFDVSAVNFSYGETYSVHYSFALLSNVSFQVSENGYLSTEQALEYTPQVLLISTLVLFFLVTVGLSVLFLLKKKIELQYVFLVLAVIIGLVSTFIRPPFTAPDEARHFFRAYDIAQGNIFVKNYSEILKAPIAIMPKEYSFLKDLGVEKNKSIYVEHSAPVIYDVFLNEISRKISGELDEFSLKATANISPLAYLPQVIFIKIGTLLSASPLVTMYLARLGNLTIWILVVFFAIQWFPKGRLLVTALGLIPSIGLLAGSSSTDTFLLAAVLALFAYLFRMAEDQKHIDWYPGFIILFGLATIIANIKLPYVLLILLFLTIKTENDKKRKSKIITICALVIGVLVFLLWNFFIGVDAGTPPPSVFEHILFVLTKPLQFLQLILSNLQSSSLDYVGQVFSGSLSSFGVNEFSALSYLLFVVILALRMPTQFLLNQKYSRFCFWGIGLVLVFSLFFVSFTWQQVGLGYLWGIQGRYFLPVIFLFAFTISTKELSSKDEDYRVYSVIFMIWSTISSCVALVNAYL